MVTKDLINQIRLYLDDMNKTKYSDFEIITSINIAMDIVNTALTEIRSHLIQKEVTVTTDSYTLPKDFNRMVMVTSPDGLDVPFYNGNDKYKHMLSYTVVGNKAIPTGITRTLKGCTVIYEYSYNDVTNIEDEINLPKILIEPMKLAIADFVLKQNVVQGREMLRNEVQRIAIGREVDYYEPTLSFHV